MRTFFTLIISASILFGAYVYSFGVPAALEPYLAGKTGVDTAASAPAGAARSPAGRPGGRGGASATMVVLTALELQPYEDVQRAIGSADAIRSADVVTNVSGEVIMTNLAANRLVEAGDILMQLDARTEELNLDISQTELTQANETVARYERLKATGNSTVTEVTMSEAKVAQRLAEAKVGLAQVAVDNRTIRAPISGKLGLSDVQVGDTVSAGYLISTIDDSEALLVEFELPERSVGLLSEEQTILASTPSFVGRVFEGKVVSFDSRIDSVTRSVTVQARIENSDGLLWPGMTFSVRLTHQSAPLAVLPSTAITWSRSGSSVWVDNEGTAEQVAATILFRRDEQVWIEADIPEGTMVVTEGAHKLRAGAKITTADAPQRRPAQGQRNPAAGRGNPEIGQAQTGRPAATEEPT